MQIVACNSPQFCSYSEPMHMYGQTYDVLSNWVVMGDGVNKQQTCDVNAEGFHKQSVYWLMLL